MERVNVLGVPIAAIDLARAADRIEAWIEAGARTYVTVTGVHGVMESRRDPALLGIHRRAGMCVPDGMPTVWVGRLRGHRTMRRVYGPDLMLEVCRRSVDRGHTHFLYGGRPGVVGRLRRRLEARFPGLRIVGTATPPFRALRDDEQAALERRIARLRPDVLWVGLGTPKQERFMAAELGRLETSVMIGVGAAFDFHAGLVRQAPRLVQQAGLEWLFRLAMEPRRLWRRYLRSNPLFLASIAGQLLGVRRFDAGEDGRGGEP